MVIRCYFKEDLDVPVDSRVAWRYIITAEGSSLDHVSVEVWRRGGQMLYSYSGRIIDCLRRCPAQYVSKLLEVLAIVDREINIEDVEAEE